MSLVATKVLEPIFKWTILELRIRVRPQPMTNRQI